MKEYLASCSALARLGFLLFPSSKEIYVERVSILVLFMQELIVHDCGLPGTNNLWQILKQEKHCGTWWSNVQSKLHIS